MESVSIREIRTLDDPGAKGPLGGGQDPDVKPPPGGGQSPGGTHRKNKQQGTPQVNEPEVPTGEAGPVAGQLNLPSQPELVQVILNEGALPRFSVRAVPRLAEPEKYDSDTLSELLAELTNATTTLGLYTARAKTDLDAAARKDLQQKAKEQMEIAMQKAKEAADNAEKNRIAGWCSAIFGLIGAAFGCLAAVCGVMAATAATVATGGAAAPLAVGSVLLVIAAVTGALMAIQEVVNMGLQEGKVEVPDPVNGGMKPADCSFGGLVDAIVTAQILDGSIAIVKKDENGNVISDTRDKAKGNFGAGCIVMDEKQLEEWKTGWTVTTSLLVAIGSIACGIGGAVGIEKALKGTIQAGKALQQLERVGAIVDLFTDVGQAAAAISEGVVGIFTAHLHADTDRARAAKNRYDQMLKLLGEQMRATEDLVQAITTQMDAIITAMSENIAGVVRNRQTIAVNIGGPNA
ncbi:MAG: type III secretion system translocon subunit SctE [Pseudomonadota bacterium]